MDAEREQGKALMGREMEQGISLECYKSSTVADTEDARFDVGVAGGASACLE